MSLRTTTIGAYPKPEYVTVPDWFKDPDGPDTADPTRERAAAVARLGDQAEENDLGRAFSPDGLRPARTSLAPRGRVSPVDSCLCRSYLFQMPV